MNDTGWIKLWRKLQDHVLWKRTPFSYGQAWVDLLLLANHAPGCIWPKGSPIPLEPGQVGHAKETLARRWGWSRGKVTRFLDKLENAHQIEQHKNCLTTVVTITNWDRYQKTDTQTDSKRTSGGHQTDTNKNDKNEKNERNGAPPEQAGRLAELLWDLLRQRKSDFRKPDLTRWARDIDRLTRLDGRTPERIEAVLRWSQADPFWQNNILSAQALRKHFDRLELQMSRSRPPAESLEQIMARLEQEGEIA